MKNPDRETPRLLLITDHLAPYNIHTFNKVHKRHHVDINVSVLSERTTKHEYWPAMNAEFQCIQLAGTDTEEGKDKGTINWNVLKTIRNGRYDVVGVSGYSEPTQALALIYCIISRQPFIWILDSIIQTRRSLIRRVLKNIPLRLIGLSLGAAWVPGAATSEYLQYYGVPRRKIFQGCYCLDSEALLRQMSHMELRRAQLRREYGIPEEAFVFLFIGRMISERGLKYLTESFRDIQNTHPEAFLVLVGTGPELPQVKEFIAKSIQKNVLVFPPTPIDNLAAYYAICDCYVHPSISETYSLTTAHAAIVGKPMIISDQVGAAQDYLRAGDTGYKVPAGSSKSLRIAMEEMIGISPQKRNEMSVRAKVLSSPRNIEWAAMQLESAVLYACSLHPKRETSSRGNR